MSAPSIPNLLSLRASSRGGTGRGRGSGRAGRGGAGVGGGSAPASTPGANHDATIQGTDTDAALSRLSAVELGYLDDPFARLFVQPTAPRPSARRLPIINRGAHQPFSFPHLLHHVRSPLKRTRAGTYTRTTAIDAIVGRFLNSTEGRLRQIVSLGAGTDTRALRIFASLFSSSSPSPSPPPPARHRDITYHEIDFPAICARKLAAVRAAAPQLQSVIAVTPSDSSSDAASSWHAVSATEPTNHLWCHGLDLRALATTRPDSEKTLPLPLQVRPDLPTLLISECCLCYLDPAEAGAVLACFAARIADLGIVLYEPVKPDDPFGRMMVSNLAVRRIRMPTLDVYKEPRDQERRLRDVGFDRVRHLTIDAVWARWVSHAEKERLDALEGLDEVEEWLLLAGHYIVAWAWRGDAFELPET